MGIGSKIKDRIRKIMPNELAEFNEKAAPFVAPFNPVIAAAMAAQGSFDRTGSIGDSVKKGIGTYITGQALRGIGGAGFQQGIGGTSAGGIGSYFTSPFTGQATFGPERGSFFRGEGSIFGELPTDAPVQATGQMPQGFVDAGAAETAATEAATQATGLTQGQMPQGFVDPGVASATEVATQNVVSQAAGVTGQGVQSASAKFSWKEFMKAPLKDKASMAAKWFGGLDSSTKLSLGVGTVSAALQYLENKGADKQRKDFALFQDRPTDFYNLQYRGGQQAKDGGIIGLANGGEPAMEMDYRGGGFIPVGAKERADDVPARLSKNEFVMTADAVRAAGGGSVDLGAQRMYDLMNKLEAQA